MENRVLFKIRVTGRVQGVGFRWSAVNEAKRLGISGYVKNMSDGSVYIEAEGNSEQLNVFLIWCRSGPGFGNVESIYVETVPPVNYTDFKIEH